MSAWSHRYDFDGSGTINNDDELKQLTYNLVFTLKLELRARDIDRHIVAFGDVGRTPLDFEQYWHIFEHSFLARC